MWIGLCSRQYECTINTNTVCFLLRNYRGSEMTTFDAFRSVLICLLAFSLLSGHKSTDNFYFGQLNAGNNSKNATNFSLNYDQFAMEITRTMACLPGSATNWTRALFTHKCLFGFCQLVGTQNTEALNLACVQTQSVTKSCRQVKPIHTMLPRRVFFRIQTKF